MKTLIQLVSILTMSIHVTSCSENEVNEPTVVMATDEERQNVFNVKNCYLLYNDDTEGICLEYIYICGLPKGEFASRYIIENHPQDYTPLLNKLVWVTGLAKPYKKIYNPDGYNYQYYTIEIETISESQE